MKFVLTLFLSAILATFAPAQKQPAKPTFTLVLSPDSATTTLGAEVWVTVRWTNNSDQDLDASANVLDATNVDPNFLFELLNESGHRVPMKVFVFPQNSGHAEFGKLKPGETIKHDVNLLRLFDLRQAGKYTLQVSRIVPQDRGGGTIKSNKITIIVTQEKAGTEVK